MMAAVELGTVTVPSGVLVLGMAGWIDYWPQTGESLSQRAAVAAMRRGGHLRDGLCEAIAARASPGPLVVRAAASPSPFNGEPTIAVLKAGLGIAWPPGAARDPVLLGDLPVDRCGMVLGDAGALDAFAGIGGPATDGLADVAYWGLHEDAAHAVFGGEVLASPGRPRGWLDLSAGQARALGAALAAWADEHVSGRGLMISVTEHTDYTRLDRATWGRPLGAAVIDVAGCQVLGLRWGEGDHSMLHRGERPGGCVYPVTLEPDDAGGTALRWTILPDELAASPKAREPG
jgi:hypothetical protein